MMKFDRYAKLAVLPVLLMLPLGAQQSDAGSPGITRQQADEILNELRQIRQLLEKQGQGNKPPEPLRAKVDLSGAEMLGNKSAPLTIVEFTDYQCPFCQRFHMTV